MTPDIERHEDVRQVTDVTWEDTTVQEGQTLTATVIDGQLNVRHTSIEGNVSVRVPLALAAKIGALVCHVADDQEPVADDQEPGG